MTKKHVIALADAIIDHNRVCDTKFSEAQIQTLARYIAGKCGPNGGEIKGR